MHDAVTWSTANLMDVAEIAPLAHSDVVFCRNVFIYFSNDAIRRTAHAFSARMPRGGYLFLGASESLTRFDSAFNLVELGGAFVYVNGAEALVPLENRDGRAAGAPASRASAASLITESTRADRAQP